jgi:hypothetical protein
MPRWMTRRDERGAATRHVEGDQGPGGGNGIRIGSQSGKSRPCYLAGPSVAAVNKIKTGLPFQRPNASLRRAALERSRGRSRGAVDVDGDGAHLHHQKLVDRACQVSSPRASSAVDLNRTKTGIAQNAAGVTLFRGPMACRLVDRTGKAAALDVSVEAKSNEGQGQASRSQRTSPGVFVSLGFLEPLGHFVSTTDGHLTGGEWPQRAGIHLPSWLAAGCRAFWGTLEAGPPCTIVSKTLPSSPSREAPLVSVRPAAANELCLLHMILLCNVLKKGQLSRPWVHVLGMHEARTAKYGAVLVLIDCHVNIVLNVWAVVSFVISKIS